MEKSIADFASTYNLGFIISSVIFFGVLVFRIITVKKSISQRSLIWKANAPLLVWILKLGWIAGMVFFLMDIPTWFLGVAMFRYFISPGPYLIFMLILISIALVEIVLGFTVTQSLITQFVKRILFLLLVVFCSFSFGLAALINPGFFDFPPRQECAIIRFPANGYYHVLHGGQSSATNMYQNFKLSANYRFGADFIRLNPQTQLVYKTDGVRIEDFYSYYDSILAPADGWVDQILDSLPDQALFHPEDSLHFIGNYVSIRTPAGKYIFLGCLRNVKAGLSIGDTIRTGDFIAYGGNSGDSPFPHLHIHIQNSPRLYDSTAMGIPFRFSNVQFNRYGWWNSDKDPALIRNDKLKTEY